MHITNKQPLPAVTLAAIGVVYGDIGTSPLYTLRECLTGQAGITMTQSSIFGFLSLIFWLLMLVVSVKYIGFVMRADNDGEGGILTLMSLAVRKINPRWFTVTVFIGLIGGSFFYGDGVITPAISVLSAIEGLEIIEPSLDPSVYHPEERHRHRRQAVCTRHGGVVRFAGSAGYQWNLKKPCRIASTEPLLGDEFLYRI